MSGMHYHLRKSLDKAKGESQRRNGQHELEINTGGDRAITMK